MRKIEKDLSKAPKSLDSKISEVIQNQKYKKVKFNKHTKDSLKRIYNNKCAYCEKRIVKNNAENTNEKENSIEHYRPKSKYYWLAFSWDNLLWCCTRCNTYKSDEFEIVKNKVVYDKSFDSNMHTSTKEYNNLEEPKMVHPELEDIMDKLIFDKKGKISSNNNRVQYTIDCCRLDRDYLNTKRKKIFDDFIKKVEDAIAQNNRELMKSTILEFQQESNDRNNEFIAFRTWVMRMK